MPTGTFGGISHKRPKCEYRASIRQCYRTKWRHMVATVSLPLEAGFLLREEWPLAARGKRPSHAVAGRRGGPIRERCPLRATGKGKTTSPPDRAASIHAQRASRARDGSRMAETRLRDSVHDSPAPRLTRRAPYLGQCVTTSLLC